jgi:hypothetical protein
LAAGLLPRGPLTAIMGITPPDQDVQYLAMASVPVLPPGSPPLPASVRAWCLNLDPSTVEETQVLLLLTSASLGKNDPLWRPRWRQDKPRLSRRQGRMRHVKDKYASVAQSMTQVLVLGPPARSVDG